MTSPMGGGGGMFIEKSCTTKGQKAPFKKNGGKRLTQQLKPEK
jgi:hypothetical protein